MALGLYAAPDASAQLNLLSPFTVTFDGRIGGAQDRLIYVHNDDPTLWYSGITVAVRDVEGVDITDDSVAGWSWRLMSKDIVPTEEEWELVTHGASLSLSSNLGSAVIGDIITFLPVWVRVQIPRGQAISVIKDVTLRITATENLV